MKEAISTPTGLTGSQESIWVGQKINPKSTANHLPHTFEIKGKIDVSAFWKAFDQLIAKHDSLRTVFQENEEGEVSQVILSEKPFQAETILSSLNDYKGLIQDRIKVQMELSRSCFDTCLIQIEDDHLFWYLNVHHIVADATSFKVWFEDLSQIYLQLIEGVDSESKPATSFKEYREFEQKKRSQVENLNEDYWGSKGQSMTKSPELYGKHTKNKGSKAKRIKLPINDELKEKFEALISSEGYRSLNPDLTKFTFLATLFSAFISRLSGENRIRIGSPFPNRNLSKYKNTTGLLIEVLPIDIAIADDDSFRSLFDKVRTELFDFFKNGHPGAQSVQSSRGIHFVVNYIPLHFGDFAGFPTKTKWLFPDELDNSHQIRLQAFDFNSQSNLDYYFDINESYFSSKHLELISEHFKSMFRDVLEDDQQLITSLRLEATENVKPYGEADHQDITPLSDQLTESFQRHQKSAALKINQEEISYKELDNLVTNLSIKLQQLGVGPGKIAVVNLNRSIEYIASVLSVLRLGGRFVPVPADVPEKRKNIILEDVSPTIVISNEETEAYPNFRFNWKEFFGSSDSEPFEYLNQSEAGYILFTSGSTGKPKGVDVSVKSLSNYVKQGVEHYNKEGINMPFFTSIGFDLTLTSLFLPLATGGVIDIFPETKSGPDLRVLEVLKSNSSNTIKLTPSHAKLLSDEDWKSSSIQTVIFGGENLESSVAAQVSNSIGNNSRVFNEYGPTEATVGCIVHEYNPQDENASVLIGKAIKGCSYLILDEKLNPVPEGVPGELYLSGDVLAKGYFNNPKRTNEAFIDEPKISSQTIYKTGDLVRLTEDGNLDYLGRKDEQIKLNGVRIEANELESIIGEIPEVEGVQIATVDANQDLYETPEFYCKSCGLPSNYPDATFNDEQVCSLCESFEDYQRNVSSYFKSMDNLRGEIISLGEGRNPEYDCLMLLSGGKDSSYALAKLVELDLKVLAFTLDNGFISDNAKENINNTCSKLGVDHIYGTTDAMNAIFRDSIERHQNVCNGCFKTVYTLSTKLAMDKNIPVIVTGLSRGQFFETRLTEELFVKENFDPKDIDNIILEARKSYHRSQDAVSEYLDVSMFETDEVFEKVAFVDFYRFSDVSLSELYSYLEEKIGWKRPEDTGRSTNCIINDLGIYVHKRRKGYHNYAFPYSWDVRVGHKKRTETIDELNDHLTEEEIQKLMKDIGMSDSGNKKEIRAYFKASRRLEHEVLISHLKENLPQNMVPSSFIQVDSFPLTPNGKVDKDALIRRGSATIQKDQNRVLEPPKNKIETLVHSTWCTVLKMDAIDVTDSFIPLGGNSLSAIRIVSLLSKKLNLEIGIQNFFELGSIRALSRFIESEIKKKMGIS